MPRKKRTPAENRAIYARRRARAAAQGTTVYARRQARARAEGWDNETQRRYWRRRLTDSFVRELGEEIGGPVEPWRPGSLMSVAANEIVNPRDQPRSPGDWRIRLLRAAGRI